MNGTLDATDGLVLGAPPHDQGSPPGPPGGLRASLPDQLGEFPLLFECQGPDNVDAGLALAGHSGPPAGRAFTITA